MCPIATSAYRVKIGHILGCCFRAKPAETKASKAAMGKTGAKKAAVNFKLSKSTWLVAIKCKNVNAASGNVQMLAKMKDFQLLRLQDAEFLFSSCIIHNLNLHGLLR